MRGLLTALFFIQSAVANEAGIWSQNAATTDFLKEMRKATAEDSALRAEIRAKTEDRKQRLNRDIMSKSIRVPDSGHDNEFSRMLDEYAEYEESGLSMFNASSYSFKYVGCSKLSGYSTDLAMDEDAYTVLQSDYYVSFRLCPSSTCSDSNAFGCSFNYGDYLVPMSDYLAAISVYRQDDLSMYCNYCEQCMYFENYFYGNRRDLGNNAQHACKYYDSCVNYEDACVASDDDATSYKYMPINENYFGCQQVVSAEDGKAYYVGPYCGSDRSTISIGVFADEFCSDYVGDEVEFSQVTGMELDENVVADLSNGDCISCSPNDNPYSISTSDGITYLCESLYEASARCDDRIFEDIYEQDEEVQVSYEATYDNLSDSQLSREANQCSYIERASKGQYDSNGVIHLDSENSLIYVQDSTYVGKANRVMYDLNNETTDAQIYALSFLALGCVLLVIAAIVLHQQAGRRPSLMDATQRHQLSHDEKIAAKRDDSILMTRSSGSDTWA